MLKKQRRTTVNQSDFITKIHGLEMKKRDFALQENPSQIYEQTDASPISIYTCLCLYNIYINYIRRSIAVGL